jgi:hypothetical protein
VRRRAAQLERNSTREAKLKLNEDSFYSVRPGADPSSEVYVGPQPPTAELAEASEPTPIATGCETMPL